MLAFPAASMPFQRTALPCYTFQREKDFNFWSRKMLRRILSRLLSYLTLNSSNSRKELGPADILCVPWFLCDLNPLRIERIKQIIGSTPTKIRWIWWIRRVRQFSNSQILDKDNRSLDSFSAVGFFLPLKIGEAFFSMRLFRPSKMVAEIYWQSDERARSRRWLTIKRSIRT